LLSITSCCSQLQHLNITGAVQQGADLSPLLQLQQSCTSLRVGGKAFSDESVHVLVQLRELQELHWVDSPLLTDLGVEQLTALNLQSLFVRSGRLSEQMRPSKNVYLLKLESSAQWVSADKCLCDGVDVQTMYCMPVLATHGCGGGGGKLPQLLSMQSSTSDITCRQVWEVQSSCHLNMGSRQTDGMLLGSTGSTARAYVFACRDAIVMITHHLHCQVSSSSWSVVGTHGTHP
jgi:hypothetical protein